MIQLLTSSLTQVFKTASIQRSQLESMMKVDFKIGHERENLMQLCFSNLAAWPLMLLIGLIYFASPLVNMSLQQLLQNKVEIIFWFLDGRTQNAILFFILFFVLQWVFRLETFFIALLFFGVAKSDIHFHLALSSLAAIILSRGCYQWWLHTDLESQTRRTWIMTSALQLLGWVVATIVIIALLNQMHLLGYFAESATVNRFEFLFLALILFYFFQFLFTCIWGHFNFQKAKEPTDFPIHYSTATWILRFKLRNTFKKQLLEQAEKYVQLHQQNLDDLKSINSDLGPVSIPAKIAKVLQQEIEYLKMACSKLTNN